jgi:hypothetical protein
MLTTFHAGMNERVLALIAGDDLKLEAFPGLLAAGTVAPTIGQAT